MTGYRVTAVATGETKTVSARTTSVTFTDVVGNRPRTNANTFTVVTVNDYLSTTSAASTTSTLLPERAVAVAVTGGHNSVDVTWSAPADIETPIVKYTVELISSSNAVAATIETTESSVEFSNLTSGNRYRARVYVHTAWGRSAVSAQSNQALVQGVPSSPANALVRQVSGNTPAINVELGAVVSNGCAVTQWQAQASWLDQDGLPQTSSLSSNDLGSSITFTDVVIGSTYQISVSATNCWGTSALATYSITPVALPEPISDLDLSLSETGDLIATWVPSTSSDVTSVLVTLQPGNISYRVSPSTTKVVFAGVNLGVEYRVTGTSRNAAGNGQSIESPSVLAAIAPGAVNDLNISVDEATAIATASWAAPNNSGAEISGYRIWVDGQAPEDITDLAVEIEGLVAGEIYSFTIAAISDLGIGTPTTTTFGLANDPVLEEAEPGVVVVWALPNSLRAVKNVVVEKKVGTKWKTVATVKAKTGKYTIAKSKKTDVYRVKAIVSKKKQVTLKIKLVRK